ncbi:MAG: DUF3352 domain-containing protein, partial [Thermostichus sp. DG02_2_bins_29]
PQGLTLQAVGLALGLNFRGLLAESAAVWHGPPGFSLPGTQAFRPQILKHLPDETLALISGQNLAQVWGSLAQIQPITIAPLGLQVDPAGWLNTFASRLELDWQLLLPKTGEFALVHLPAGERDPSWLLVSEVPEPAGTSLEEVVQAQGWQVVSIPIAEGTATAWAKPMQQEGTQPDAVPQPTQSIPSSRVPVLATSERVASAFAVNRFPLAEAIPDNLEGIPEPPPLVAQIYHVERDGYSYLASSLAALEAALQDPPLSAERSWRRLVSPLPHRNLGYGYTSLGVDFAEFPLWKEVKGSRLASTRVVFTTTAITAAAAPYPDQGRWITQTGKLFWQWY